MICNVFPEQKRYAFELTGMVASDKAENGFANLQYSKTSNGILFEGFLGEIVFADEFGLPRPVLLKGRIDKGYDFVVDGLRVEVKSTTNPKEKGFDFILEKKALRKEPDLFVFVVFGFGKKTARIFGIYRQEFTKLMRLKNYGYGERISVPIEEMKPVECFFEKTKRGLEEFV